MTSIIEKNTSWKQRQKGYREFFHYCQTGAQAFRNRHEGRTPARATARCSGCGDPPSRWLQFRIHQQTARIFFTLLCRCQQKGGAGHRGRKGKQRLSHDSTERKLYMEFTAMADATCWPRPRARTSHVLSGCSLLFLDFLLRCCQC